MLVSEFGFVDSLGRNIKAERYRRGFSQEKLAEKTGLHRTYIGVIERGEKNITIRNCCKIADALNIRLSDLIRMSEDGVAVSRLSFSPEE